MRHYNDYDFSKDGFSFDPLKLPLEKLKESKGLKNNLQDFLNGKNTIEAARILSEEFVRLFGNEWGNVAQLFGKFLPRGKASTWEMFDRNINLFCRQFYSTQEDNQEQLNFLDEVRFLITSLPKKHDYKLPEQKQDYPSPQVAAHHFATCSLCWRAVPRKPLEKKTPLCTLHDIPSNAPEYRKRLRMKKRVEQTKLQLTKSLPPLFPLKETGVELNLYIQNLCLSLQSPLSHLVAYLSALNITLGSGEDILRAIEHTPYQGKLTNFLALTWAYYFEDRGEHFRLNYTKILAAEAWLRVEEDCKHGGKRSKS